MSRSKLPHRRDANQGEIIGFFEALGCTVADTSALGGDFPDIVAGVAGRNLLVEIKTDDGKLTEGQDGFRERWRGQYDVVRNQDDVVSLVQAVRKGLRT